MQNEPLRIYVFPAKELEYGEANTVRADGVMTMCRDTAGRLAEEYDAIADIGIRIIRPEDHGEHTNNILDVIPIATKALGRVGEGTTYLLGGVYVILTAVDSTGRQVANFGACDGPIGERIAWGRPGTPDEDDLLIFFDVEVKAGLWSERETMFEVESACDRFIQEYRMCMKGFNSKQAVQKYVFEDSYDPSKPDIAIMKEVPGQGAVYETWALADEPCGVKGGFSVITAHWMPLVFTPNEYRDGVLHAFN